MLNSLSTFAAIIIALFGQAAEVITRIAEMGDRAAQAPRGGNERDLLLLTSSRSRGGHGKEKRGLFQEVLPIRDAALHCLPSLSDMAGREGGGHCRRSPPPPPAVNKAHTLF